MNKYKYLIFPVAVSLICIIALSIIFASTTKNVRMALADDSTQIREIQQRLYDWGYFDGPITGYYGDLTRAAVRKFQAAHGITVSGELDMATMNAIGVYINTQTSNDVYLLAKCIYAEARGEPYVGKVAVGAVILNRVASPEFPNTIYGVIYQPWAFTAVHDGQINLEPDTSAYQAAKDALSGWDPSYGSLFYYNPAVATSSWIFNREIVVTIGKHVFAR